MPGSTVSLVWRYRSNIKEDSSHDDRSTAKAARQLSIDDLQLLGNDYYKSSSIGTIDDLASFPPKETRDEVTLAT